ncbi:hypothetical protein [Pseudofrankia asymbiotica]|uniref:Uncharacterized protein n=1 Tax=Pseudofrankia asymbiotica TaxID=1834516 RepID=A0A1V2IA56_9ACTN|nr:hypothetical protein [Pseudofrankia asymbiotica]ONH29766.1 hypothetical protein BL253_16080 [Pseudofrankia asymbiotica]
MRRAGGLVDGELIDILFPGRWVVRAELDGRAVDAVFRLDAVEHERRVRFGLGALSYPRLLRRLAGMPPGVLVEDPDLLVEASLLPDGVVACSADGVGRLVEPPLTLDAVVVAALGMAQTRHVRVAERFAPYASRWVVSGDARFDPAVFVAASVHGVGLAGRRPDVDVVAVAAPPAGRARPGHAWLLAEQVYGAWLTTGARVGRTRTPNVATDVGETPAGLISAN